MSLLWPICRTRCKFVWTGVPSRPTTRARRELSVALKPERDGQTYGDVTRKLVSIFQRERHLQLSGEVDEATANVLNALLKEWVFPPGAIPRLAKGRGILLPCTVELIAKISNANALLTDHNIGQALVMSG